MATTQEYLSQLQADKQTLVNNLVTKGVSASNDETFTSLVPKVLDIQIGSGDFEINDASYLFYLGARLEIFEELIKKIKNVTNFNFCFYGAFNSIEQETLDLSTIDMSNCSTFRNMFYNTNFTPSITLKNIVLPNNLKSAINCYGMFYGVYLPSLDLSDIIFENIVDATNMFYNAEINSLTLPTFKVSSAASMFYQFGENTYDETIPFNDNLDISSIDFSECTTISGFIRTSKIKSLTHDNFDCSKIRNIGSFASNQTMLENLCPLLNLGKGYTQKSANYNSYKLDLSSCVNLTHDSLVGIINGLYDLNLTYDVAGGGTLYTQQLVLGSTNLAKLTEDEIAIGTNKGWVIS